MNILRVMSSPVKYILKQLGYGLVKISPYSPYLKNAFASQKYLLKDKNVSIIFDIGAFVGHTTRKYISLFPQASIYSFEPFPESFNTLVDEFKHTTTVKPINMAIADSSGSRVLYENVDWPRTNSLLPRSKNERRYYPKGADRQREARVRVTTIDDFCQNNAVTKVDILKMDIQGGELMALKGAGEALDKNIISLIYTEVMFVPHYEQCALFYGICHFLSRYNYTLYDMYNMVYGKNGQLRCADAIFVSAPIRKSAINTAEPEP